MRNRIRTFNLWSRAVGRSSQVTEDDAEHDDTVVVHWVKRKAEKGLRGGIR